MKVRCVDNSDVKLLLTEGKVYDAVLGEHYRLNNDRGISTRYIKERFEIVPEEKEQPKMGAIYLVCIIENTGLKAKDFDVIPSDLTGETFIEHSLDAAKKHLEELNAAIQEEGESDAHVACIFEMHSYYENRPFFVEVKR